MERFACVFAYYLFFVGCTIFHEIHGCLSLIRYSPNSMEKFDGKAKLLSRKTVVAAILMKMKSRFSGKMWLARPGTSELSLS